MELQQHLAEIERTGLGLAAISYDSPAILKSFSERQKIAFPLLSDPGSKTIITYGLLNESAPKGPFYGIPYPGTFILDSRGVVVAKYFEQDYTQRYTSADILVKEFGAAPDAAHSTVQAKHLWLSASAGDAAVHTGQRIVLAVDVDLPAGVHVYAPGVKGYIPVELSAANSPAYAVHAAVYPESRMMRLPVIGETVPVYTGRFRVLQEITIAKGVSPGAVTVNGTFRYQACDDRECFIPETVPLSWALRVEPLDRQRAPVEIQHKAQQK